ncbi:MAG: chromate efflux transporter [Proteobacteria bacterium]|nr:chromate efflux transporter [Pseudomonadota bacterium]
MKTNEASGKGSDHIVSYMNLFVTFLKIGSTAFGGFMALISVVQDLAVERKKWLSHQEMLDGISLATILPGPVAVNVVAYVGFRVRGVVGAVIAASAVTLPSFILIVSLSAVYFSWGHIPVISSFFQGLIPTVLAIIIVSAWRLALQAVIGPASLVILISAIIALLSISGFLVTLAVVVGSGIAGAIIYGPLFYPARKSQQRLSKKGNSTIARTSALAINPLPVAAFFAFTPVLTIKLMTVFAGMSLMLFGGGYVFIPLIQQVVVAEYGWVTQKEFIDSIAMGQVTPGPILISAAFIGYKVAGLVGALAATIGIFTPPAILMIVASHGLEKIKSSIWMAAALKGVRPAVVGMIFAASVIVAKTATAQWPTAFIFLATIILMIRFKLQVAWLIPMSGFLGIVLYQ